MKKFLSGIVCASGLFLLIGSVGGIEHNTMPLIIGGLLSVFGLAMIGVGLYLLENVCGLDIWGD